MLRGFIFWRVTKITYFTALLLSLIVLVVQVYRLSFIILGLPISSSFPFFLSWFVYYSFFFIPDGILVAVALVLHDLKEKKLLQVMESFHISPYKVLALFSMPVGVFLVLSFFFSFLLFEEQVSFATRSLLIKYKDRLFENLPEKTFLEAGGMVVYVREREGSTLKGVFLKYRDSVVVAERAVYEGEGRFFFRKGYLVTKERGKYFLMSFDTYRLDTEERFSAQLRKKRIAKERILNLLNTAFIPILFLCAFFGTLKLCRTHLQVYYLIALFLVAHQLFIFSLKVTL